MGTKTRFEKEAKGDSEITYRATIFGKLVVVVPTVYRAIHFFPKMSTAPLFFSVPPSTQLNLPFCAGVQFSHDYIRVFKYMYAPPRTFFVISFPKERPRSARYLSFFPFQLSALFQHSSFFVLSISPENSVILEFRQST